MARVIGWEKALACVGCLGITHSRLSAEASAPQVNTQGHVRSVYADRTLDFTGAESVIVKDGARLLTCRAERSAIFTIAWDVKTQTLVTPAAQRIDL
jgi:hypothetical protein